MDPIQADGEPLALVAMEVSTVDDAVPARDHGASRAAPGEAGIPGTREPDLPLASDDRFLASAAREYDEGRIDQVLWARASAQSSDESRVVATYLRARATALQLAKRERRRQRQAKRIAASDEANNRTVEPKARSKVSPPRRSGARFKLNSRVAAAAASAAFASVVAASWWIVSPGESDLAEPPSAPVVASSRVAPAAAAPLKQPVAATGAVVKESESLQEVKATMQRLKEAGNWNVFVLYASKWTRDEPANAAAWDELSNGYARLHQLDDALFAATKAAQLSPEDVALWRNVGHLNLALERLPEAGGAFDKVLAANSDDTDALCGNALVAHGSGRLKDAFAIAARVRAAGGMCQGLSDGESVAVVVKTPVTAKFPSSIRR